MPPASKPSYPGGAPIRRETACFSIYSDMSKRVSCLFVVEQASASALAISVLPTPEGPRNMKAACGVLVAPADRAV